MTPYLLPFLLLSLGLTATVSATENPKKGDAKQHHFLQLFDNNKDGKVSEMEFKTTMQARYKTMDGDHNGIVSMEELKQYSTQHHKNWQHKKHDKIDSNKNGLISQQEFVAHALKRANKQFSRLDKNQDGQISLAENMQKHHNKKLHLLKKMDKNDDGQITRQEHSAMSHRWFAKLDTNNDNTVSADELKGRWHN